MKSIKLKLILLFGIIFIFQKEEKEGNFQHLNLLLIMRLPRSLWSLAMTMGRNLSRTMLRNKNSNARTFR